MAFVCSPSKHASNHCQNAHICLHLALSIKDLTILNKFTLDPDVKQYIMFFNPNNPPRYCILPCL